MHIIAKRPPNISIYSCEDSGIHLVYNNINIGMHPTEFCMLNENVQEAMYRIDQGTWPCPYVSLTYSSTVICLKIDDLGPLASVMQGAATAIEAAFDLVIDDLKRPDQKIILSECIVPELGRQLDTITPDYLLYN